MPTPASAAPVQTRHTHLEVLLSSYVSPMTRIRPENMAQYIANIIRPTPPQAPGTPAFEQFEQHRLASWLPFLRFVALRQMQDVTEVAKLLSVVGKLVSRGVLDVGFLTDSMLEAYNLYGMNFICANRLYGFVLLLQANGWMLQVEYPAPLQEPPGVFHRFLAPARPHT
ncbi:hypothetical protein F5X99DRAFT_369989 [Biscogniauxia marginata]|nr:hypothetical protein F5X99DRAFT_369989 [Biscogniauxia marginata]